MENDLKTRTPTTLEPEVHRERPLARVQAVPWLIVIVLLAAVAWLGWKAFLERKAAVFAKNPEVLALARQAAKDAIRQNLAIPLEVAGYGDVTVRVRFDGEAAPAR